MGLEIMDSARECGVLRISLSFAHLVIQGKMSFVQSSHFFSYLTKDLFVTLISSYYMLVLVLFCSPSAPVVTLSLYLILMMLMIVM